MSLFFTYLVCVSFNCPVSLSTLKIFQKVVVKISESTSRSNHSMSQVQWHKLVLISSDFFEDIKSKL